MTEPVTCRRGHPFTDDNPPLRYPSTGDRILCRACARDAARRRRAARGALTPTENAARARRARWDAKPVPGRRPVLAKTCTACGRLLPGHDFGSTSRGYLNPRCRSCVSVAYRESASEETLRAQYLRNLDRRRDHGGRRHGYWWTGPEDEIVERTDLSVREAAEMLGRSEGAVMQRRTRLRHDPRLLS